MSGALDFSDELKEAARQWSGRCEAPSAWARKRRGGVRFYVSDFAERYFARVHPATPAVIYTVPIVYGLYRGLGQLGALKALPVFVVGILAWTLLEYVLHRWPFHLSMGPESKRLPFFLVHGYHHEYPDDPMRLVAPWPASLGGATLVGAVFYLLFGGVVFWPLMAGTLAGYVAYDEIHFYTHHAKPKTFVGKFLRRYHMEHHFKDSEAHYGISCPLWDLVFGTFRSKVGAELSPAEPQ